MKKYITFKNIAKGALSFAAIATLAACTSDFEEYNKNPYGPTAEDMKGDNVETGILIQNMIPALAQGQQNNSQMIDQMVGLEYGGHCSMINPWGNSGNFYTYNPRIGWVGITFDTTMPQIYTNFFQIQEKTEGRGVVYAWAQLLRVAASLKISDCYGPIPYSKIDGTAYNVAYDSMEELYNHMFAHLDEAIETLSAALASGADVSTLADFDYIYQGNFNKWVKFANTLKLRMAMRIVNANPTLAQQKAEEAVAAGVFTDANETAYSTFNDGMNPMHLASHIWNGGEFRVSANITAYLGGYNDPRLPMYALESTSTATGFVGVRNGVYQTASSFSTYQGYSKPNISKEDQLLVMSASEAYFLRAEGALRGWEMNGTAKELYEAGVNTSMTEKKVSIGSYLSSTDVPADYVDPGFSKYNASAPSTICPKYDESAGFEANLERIIVQKWIASYPNGWEAWADVRRTGYPKFFPVADNLSNGVVNSATGMQRLAFPQSEYNTNNANVSAAVALLGGPDNAATKLWWAKK